MPYVGEDVELINLWNVRNEKERERIKEHARQVMLAQGTDPEKSLFVQDVGEPVYERVLPAGAWLNRWKTPLMLGLAVGGGLFLLGYSGMGKPIGALATRRIEK